MGFVVSDGLTKGACVVITSIKVTIGSIGSLYDDLKVVKNGLELAAAIGSRTKRLKMTVSLKKWSLEIVNSG